MEQTYSIFFENSEVYELIKKILPRGLIYISMDGKCPPQKIECLKARGKNRYIPGIERQTEEKLMEEENRNRNSFMYLAQECNREIIYDDRLTDGEAEQKIIQYIREKKSKNEWKSKEKYYFLSNDNDMIFLLLPFIDDDIFPWK